MEQRKIVTVDNYTYICESVVWTAIDNPRWRIARVNNSTGDLDYPTVNWVPTDEYRFIPADATTLTYSYSVILPPE